MPSMTPHAQGPSCEDSRTGSRAGSLASLSNLAAAAALAITSLNAQAAEPTGVLARSAKQVPQGPWPQGDQLGMGNTQGAGTWARCAWHLAQPGAKAYEVSYERSNTMPKSPFSGPLIVKPKPVASIPGTLHAFNGEVLNDGAEPGQQGTQIDALGHFGALKAPWDGKTPLEHGDVGYYGGHSGKDVKPNADSPLLRLGIEKIPPIVTSAVLLDAKRHINGGQAMKAGDVVTAAHIQTMLKAQGLGKRGLMAGDVVYVYTGWSDHYQDPDVDKRYYASAPGLSYDAAQLLGAAKVVAVGLDAPFIDSVSDGMLVGKGAPAAGNPPGLPFAVHHHLLTQAGVHHIENARLAELARDGVYTSCTMVLPPMERGAAGAVVRPVAIGVGRLK